MRISKLEDQLGRAISTTLALILMASGLYAQNLAQAITRYHQAPDADGMYYTGPEVTAPELIKTVSVPYPDGIAAKQIQGMTVLAMVIQANGVPAHIQVLHKHGDAFDKAAIAAVQQSTFLPGKLGVKPVPVWIDVRVVFHSDRSLATPQLLITERDLPPPSESQVEDKHRNPLSYTPPYPIHSVDADFVDPFAKTPYVQVAVVSVLVDKEGLPKEVRVVRGLGFGLDEKAAAAVWHYRFLPATKHGEPIAARRDIMVSFVKF